MDLTWKRFSGRLSVLPGLGCSTDQAAANLSEQHWAEAMRICPSRKSAFVWSARCSGI